MQSTTPACDPTTATADVAEPQLDEPGSGIGTDTRFHRLGAAVGDRKWWLVIAVAVLGLAGMRALLDLLGVFASWLPDQGVPVLGAYKDRAFVYAALAVLGPLVLLLAGRLERRPPRTLLSVTGGIRWHWLGTSCLLAAAPHTAVWALLTLAVAGGAVDWVGWQAFLTTAPVFAALIPVAVVGEELLFRGLLLQADGRLSTNPWPAIVGQALVWMAVHWPSTVWGAVDITVIGILLGYLTVRTGGIEASIAFHILNNLTATLGEVAIWTDPGQVSIADTARNATAASTAIHLTLTTIALTILLLAAKYSRLATTAAAPRPTKAVR